MKPPVNTEQHKTSKSSKKVRLVFTEEQRNKLNDFFLMENRPNKLRLNEIATELNLEPTTVSMEDFNSRISMDFNYFQVGNFFMNARRRKFNDKTSEKS